MLLLSISSLYPNELQKRHGIFVRERLRHLKQLWHGEMAMIAPIPSFPFGLRKSLAYLEHVPRVERDSIFNRIFHPRYWVIPKIGNIVSPLTYYWSIKSTAGEVVKKRREVIIDAHFAFPDGVAAVLLAKRLKLPVTVTIRGSDINAMANEWAIKNWVQWMFSNADAVISVSDALRLRAIDLGCAKEKIHVIRNGVDELVFQPSDDRVSLRRKLSIGNPTLLSVGNLLELKGHDLVIQALTQLSNWHLIVIGTGVEEGRLRDLVADLGLADRVRFVLEVPQTHLAEFYAAADILVLASSREGLPNVVLEAMSCGLPVVATAVGGVPEVLNNDAHGRLLSERSSDAIVHAVRAIAVSINSADWSSPDSRTLFSWAYCSSELVRLHRALQDSHGMQEK